MDSDSREHVTMMAMMMIPTCHGRSDGKDDAEGNASILVMMNDFIMVIDILAGDGDVGFEGAFAMMVMKQKVGAW